MHLPSLRTLQLQNMEQNTFRVIVIAVILAIATAAPASSCLEYQKGDCSRCREGWTVHQGKCRSDIYGCAEYQGELCTRCIDGSPPNNNVCQLLRDQQAGDVTLYHLAFGSANAEYRQIPLQTCQQDVFFSRCDSFIKSSKYGPLISRASSPWQWVSTLSQPPISTYRITYLSPGGGALVCCIQINKTSSAIVLKSTITISNSQLISYCVDYQSPGKCSLCLEGYHLDDNACYRDIAGCTRSYHEICLQCEGWSLLIENRCLTNCPSQCDLVRAPYFGNILLEPKGSC